VVLASVPEPESGGAPSFLDARVRVRPLHGTEASNPEAALDLVLVVEPVAEGSAALLEDVFTTHRSQIRDLVTRHGNVLFRGFDVARGDFERIVARAYTAERYIWMFPAPPELVRWLLALPLIGWVTAALLGWIEASATGREIVDDRLSTLANDQTIQFPHHEYGIFFNVPTVIAFYCERQAGIGGETVICDGHAGYAEMDPAVRDRFERARHIRYRDENQWYLPPFTAPAVLRHPQTGERSMNFTASRHDIAAEVGRQLFPGHRITTDEHDETFSFAPRFVGHDGETYELTDDEVAEVARAHFAHAVLLPWHQGDVLLMDNYRVVHGRLNAGTPRKVLQLALCDHVRNTNHFTL
jgi:alpha-ketoglutarate-dependent taurine dioxygenase